MKKPKGITYDLFLSKSEDEKNKIIKSYLRKCRTVCREVLREIGVEAPIPIFKFEHPATKRTWCTFVELIPNDPQHRSLLFMFSSQGKMQFAFYKDGLPFLYTQALRYELFADEKNAITAKHIALVKKFFDIRPAPKRSMRSKLVLILPESVQKMYRAQKIRIHKKTKNKKSSHK